MNRLWNQKKKSKLQRFYKVKYKLQENKIASAKKD
jgi:hypothetical protein